MSAIEPGSERFLAVKKFLDGVLEFFELKGGRLGIVAVSSLIAGCISGLSISLRYALQFFTGAARQRDLPPDALLTTTSAILVINYVILFFIVYTPALNDAWSTNQQRLTELLETFLLPAGSQHSAEMNGLYGRRRRSWLPRLAAAATITRRWGCCPDRVLALVDAAVLQINTLSTAVLPC